jgi:hypothetical protein
MVICLYPRIFLSLCLRVNSSSRSCCSAERSEAIATRGDRTVAGTTTEITSALRAGTTGYPHAFGALLRQREVVQRRIGTPVTTRLTEKKVNFEPVEGEAVAMSGEKLQQLKGKAERVVDAIMFPVLEKLLKEEGMTLCNSEDFPWLRDPNNASNKFRQKPDFHLSPTCAVDRRFPDQHQDVLEVETNICYGTVADEMFYVDCSPVESKLKIENKDKAQLLTYLEWLSVQGHCTSRGFLFDLEDVYLMECIRGALSFVKHVKWTAPGSHDAIRSFIVRPHNRSDWFKATLAAKDSHRVDFLFAEAKASTSFMGAGAQGRVFAVRRNENHRRCAMKVVLAEHVPDLARQFARHGEVEAMNNDLPLIVLDDLQERETNASVLCEPLGRPSHYLDACGKNERMNILSAALVALQLLHEAGIAHGDARVENFIVFEERVLWIDTRTVTKHSAFDCEQDLVAFRESIESKGYELPKGLLIS